ncbi:MAG: hypothetical protein A3H06_00970 [Candidatus Colwellbacteria bacterium RIFCSPLOWO2_12_FULL_44_13]|uniref:DoxX family protein n=1 Tax=Candidatus Colwellbacteria bacterium RIFCSPLOWO2_12_FULL_44_13 TaxID=1797694 RepID=A0A1G1Z8Q8_9BACT|nr:MAG: hypothetical protein A3H06_00970 [Candidatus Colwellbacteria bacterium RIFCSPLOWO2_12_FULL_44_13]
MRKLQERFDFIFNRIRHLGMPSLRVTLAIVFLWFGLLKIFGVSPVVSLIQDTYSFMPTATFVMVLGAWETLIGLGLLFKRYLRFTLLLLWVQMLGTFFSLVLDPSMFFSAGNPFLLTLEGEFLVKNLVLLSASLAIGSHELKHD